MLTSGHRRLLYIAHRLPYPPDKGERVRAFHQLRALSQRFRITLIAPAHQPADVAAAEGLKPWCEKVILPPAGSRGSWLRAGLNLLAGRSASEGFFASTAMLDAVCEQARLEPFDLAFGYSSAVLPLLLAAPAEARILDVVDADSAKWRAYARSARWPSRWLYRLEARAVRKLEQRALKSCQAVLAISAVEAELIAKGADNLHVVGNGVDLEYYVPAGREPKTPNLVFTGQMDYRPNVEGVCWFARKIWPGLKQAAPKLTFTIVGRNPAPAVRRLASLPGVTVTGAVPDVRPFLSEATVAVVPLRIARGVQNKVLEAMAMGLPVVASPQAVQGLDVQVGADLLTASSPNRWRQVIMDLLGWPDARRQFARAARARVLADYSWPARLEPLLTLCEDLAGEPISPTVLAGWADELHPAYPSALAKPA